MHPVRVIVRGFADLGQPEFAVEHFGRDGLGPLPHVGLAHDVGNAVAGERELAVETAVGVLVDDTADRVGIFAGEHAVEYHLRHRHLAAHGFAAGFEIDRLGQAFLRLGATCVVEAQSLGRGHRPLVLAGDLALGRDRLSSAYAVLDHHARIGRQRRQVRTLDRGIEDGTGLTRGKRHGRHRRELDVGIVVRRDIGRLESRFFARRPWLDRAELLPHGIDVEIEPRRVQRPIRVRWRKGETADRAARVAVSALVG